MRRAALAIAVVALAGCGGTAGERREPARPAAALLPALPAEGLAVQDGERLIRFLTLDGRQLGVLRGYRLYSSAGEPLRVEDRRFRAFRILRSGRLVRARRGPSLPRRVSRSCEKGPKRAGVAYLLCLGDPRRLEATVRRVAGGRSTVVTRNPPATKSAHDAGRVGHWVRAFLSPNGEWLLLQWSAECETPYAFLVRTSGGVPRIVSGERDWAQATESFALGFARDGRAVVEYPPGGCGAGARRPGVYLLDPDSGSETFVHSGSALFWSR